MLEHLTGRLNKTLQDTALTTSQPTYEQINQPAEAARGPHLGKFLEKGTGSHAWDDSANSPNNASTHKKRSQNEHRSRSPPVQRRSGSPSSIYRPEAGVRSTGSPFVDSLLAPNEALEGQNAAALRHTLQSALSPQQASTPGELLDQQRTQLEIDLQERIVSKLRKHLTGEALERQIELHTKPLQEASAAAWAAASRDSFRSPSPIKQKPFDAIDTNHDGVISRAEWNVHVAMEAASPGELSLANSMQADSGGPMSRRELSPVTGSTARGARERAAELQGKGR